MVISIDVAIASVVIVVGTSLVGLVVMNLTRKSGWFTIGSETVDTWYGEKTKYEFASVYHRVVAFLIFFISFLASILLFVLISDILIVDP